MRSLLDFIYRGEVSVDQDRLTGFLKVAESLRIKGLTEVNEEKCDLPSIASSLLSSNSHQATAPPAAVPPPPPSLHRIHLSQPSSSPSSLSSPNASTNKRCIPSPSSFQPFSGNSNNNNNNNNANDLTNASSCYGQKRKRGRPRKHSGSSDTPSGASPEHDLDSDNRMLSLSLSNLSDSSYGKLVPPIQMSNDSCSRLPPRVITFLNSQELGHFFRLLAAAARCSIPSGAWSTLTLWPGRAYWLCVATLYSLSGIRCRYCTKWPQFPPLLSVAGRLFRLSIKLW